MSNLTYGVLKAFDVGGSFVVHVYGAYFGLAVSFILSKKVKPTGAAETTYGNIIFAMLGTLFLWMYWPSCNAGFFATTEFHRSLIIGNTIVSLTGSCLAAFATTSFMRRKFNMEDIINATLAGGVAIGAPSGVVANLGVSLAIGIFAGFMSVFAYTKIMPKIEHGFLGIHDTCGAHNLHGIPGLMGGLVSAMVIASYQSYPGFDESYKALVQVVNEDRSFSQQAGIQVGATFMSMGIGIIFGLLAGVVIYPFYHYETQDFFDDNHYFELPH
jgi:ammonium transporter Rh